jgi:hypothetical protein
MSASAALSQRPLVLELGCGGTKRFPEPVGIDLLELPGVDVVGDALEVLRSLPDGSVRAIHSGTEGQPLELSPLKILIKRRARLGDATRRYCFALGRRSRQRPGFAHALQVWLLRPEALLQDLARRAR